MSPAPPPTFRTTLLEPTGLHPLIRLTFQSSSARPYVSCGLHAYLTLPSAVFLDKYQLSSPNLLASKNLRGLRSLIGEADLEAPEWTLTKWGSTVLLELSPPLTERSPWLADIPLHVRYVDESPLEYSHTSSEYANITIPWPVVFWACPTDVDGKLSVNPFDRKDLGFDRLFAARTQFYHFQPSGLSTRVMGISIPFLSLEHATSVERLSMLGIIGGFLWICLALWRQAPSTRGEASKKDDREIR